MKLKTAAVLFSAAVILSACGSPTQRAQTGVDALTGGTKQQTATGTGGQTASPNKGGVIGGVVGGAKGAKGPVVPAPESGTPGSGTPGSGTPGSETPGSGTSGTDPESQVSSTTPSSSNETVDDTTTTLGSSTTAPKPSTTAAGSSTTTTTTTTSAPSVTGTTTPRPAVTTTTSPTATPTTSPITTPATTPPGSGSGPSVTSGPLPVGTGGWRDVLIRPASGVGRAGDGIGAFRTMCRFSHMNSDDPIVAPGRPGGSHLHTFFGNTAIDAFTTSQSILTTGGGSCDGGIANRSGYWVPSIIDSATGRPIEPHSLTVYYKTGYGGVRNSEVTVPPNGLRMIAGTSTATAPVGTVHWERKVNWNCHDGTATGTERQAGIARCAQGQLLAMEVKFPQCWDGINLDSPDHKRHMSYTVQGGCPASHPIAIPEIAYNVFWRTPASGTGTWRLSSDMYAGGEGGWSGHADWYNGWDPAILSAWVNNCVRAGNDCHVSNLGDGRTLYGFFS